MLLEQIFIFATFSNSRSMRLFIKEEHFCLKIVSREGKQPFFSIPLQRLIFFSGKACHANDRNRANAFQQCPMQFEQQISFPRVNQTFAIMMMNNSPIQSYMNAKLNQ